MLDFQLQQVPFRFGLAEGTDPRQVPPGTLTMAENAVWLKAGRLGKRYGTTHLSDAIVGGGNLTAASRLFARGGELCLVDGSRLYSYTPAQSLWRNVGPVNEIIPTWSTALDTQSGVTASDLAYLNGVIYYAWTTGDPWNTNVSTDLWFQAIDATSGAVLFGPSRIATGTTFGVRVLVSGSNVLVLSRTGGASPFTISAWCFSPSTLAFLTSAVALKADNATTTFIAPWDACMTASSTLVVGYNRTGAIIALESFTVSAGGAYTPAASGTVVDAAGCRAIAIDGIQGERLYVVYVQAGAAPNVMRIAINDATTLAATVAASTVDTPAGTGFGFAVAVARLNATQCVCWHNVSETTNSVLRTVSFVRSATGTAVSTSGNYYAASATTRPFVIGGKAYMGALLYTTLAGLVGSTSSCLLSADEYRYLGLTDVLVGGFPQFCSTTSAVVALSATTSAALVPFQASVTATKQNWRQGARLVRFNSGAGRPLDAYRSLAVGQEMFVSGGGLSAYDGSVIFDYGFPSTPQMSSSTVTGAGAIAAGTYLYAAITEFRSGTGLYYRSPPAASISQVTTTASSTNTVLTTNCQVGNKPNAVLGLITEGVYRTVAGGTTLQRLSFEPRFNTVYTDRSTVTQSLTDTRADTDIDGFLTTLASRPALYTTGGVLPDYVPPGNVTQFHHVDRLFVLSGDQKSWWYSKAFQDDLGTAPGFHPNFQIAFDDVQTAGASMDDKAIFFSATGVRYMLGFGPAANGQNSDFTTPVAIQTDVGCTNARSVIGTPDGVMFLSTRGIYLLTRGLEFVWIGRQVQDTLAAFPNVTSAVLVAARNEVRFTCNNVAGDRGAVLVYNYVEKQWSTFRYTQGGIFGLYGVAIADACIWNGAWTFATVSGEVYTETATTYLDDGAYVPMTLETAWISASGPLAFQSVREFALHGQSYTDHDLTVSVGFDSDTSYPQTTTFGATSPVTSVGVEECNVTIGTRRKCQTIRFKISDATPSAGTLGTGQGPAFDMMALEVGIKRGLATNPATKRA